MKYVRDQLVLAAALITKRSLFDVTNEDRESILLHIKQLLQMEADNAVKCWIKNQKYVKIKKLIPPPFFNIASTRAGPRQCTRRPILQHKIHHHWLNLGAPSQL